MAVGVGGGVLVGFGVGVQAEAVIVATCSGEGSQAVRNITKINRMNKGVIFVFILPYHSNFSIFRTTQYVSRVKTPMGPQ